LSLNEDLTLLVEGSFSVMDDVKELASSIEYIESDFSPIYLRRIQSFLENQNIVLARVFEKSGSLILELQNGVRFESFFAEGDYESWELRKKGRSIYGSECGNIVHY